MITILKSPAAAAQARREHQRLQAAEKLVNDLDTMTRDDHAKFETVTRSILHCEKAKRTSFTIGCAGVAGCLLSTTTAALLPHAATFGLLGVSFVAAVGGFIATSNYGMDQTEAVIERNSAVKYMPQWDSHQAEAKQLLNEVHGAVQQADAGVEAARQEDLNSMAMFAGASTPPREGDGIHVDGERVRVGAVELSRKRQV